MPSPRVLLPLALAAGSVLALPAAAAAQSSPIPARAAVADAYSLDVDARALDGTVPVRVTSTRATQQCPPPTKAPVTETLLDLGPVPPPNGELVRNAETLRSTASADCTEPRAVAEAETQNLELLAQNGQAMITADVVKSVAATSCTGDPSSAGSLFVNLKVGSVVVPANPAPNTKIQLGLITVIINEQQVAEGGRGMVVNGLHVIGNTALLQGDIIVSHVRSGVTCGARAGSGAGTAASSASDTKNEDFALGLVASPATVRPGQTVTYTTTLQNKSDEDCLVNKFVAHLPAPFLLASTKGALGDRAVSETRSDNGVDAVWRPDGVTIEAGKSVTQTFVATVPAGTPDGSYATTLELLCARMGNYVAGPFAPVTVRSTAVLGVRSVVTPTVENVPAPRSLPRTGAPLVALALAGLGTIAGGVVLHRQGRLQLTGS